MPWTFLELGTGVGHDTQESDEKGDGGNAPFERFTGTGSGTERGPAT